MTSAQRQLPGVARDANPTDVEHLLELYGRSVSPKPAPDLTLRVITAVARAVPGVVDPPTPGFIDRWLPVSVSRLLRGPRRLTIRFGLVAMLTVPLAAVAFASGGQRGPLPLPPTPAEAPGLAPGGSPAVTFEPSRTDDADVLGPEGPGVEDDSDSADPDDDAERDDERGGPKAGDGDDVGPHDVEADEERGSGSIEEEPGLSASDEPESDASDAPNAETDAPSEAPEPTDGNPTDTER